MHDESLQEPIPDLKVSTSTNTKAVAFQQYLKQYYMELFNYRRARTIRYLDLPNKISFKINLKNFPNITIIKSFGSKDKTKLSENQLNWPAKTNKNFCAKMRWKNRNIWDYDEHAPRSMTSLYLPY